MKKIILLLLLVSAQLFGSAPSNDKARGIFFSMGVGPRLPIFNFAQTSLLGYGVFVELSYTDVEYIPVFLFGQIGFDQFPGSQDYYRNTDYTHFSTNTLPFTGGIRYYLPPFFQNVIVIMPVVEAAGTFMIYQTLNEFRDNTERAGFLDEGVKLGGHIGVGVSMFLFDIMAAYRYYPQNQYLSFDLKLRIPLFVSY